MMNTYILILVSMIFCHVIDDYVLQSLCLVNLKQKSWWEANTSDQKYRHDYLVGLLMHSISWGFMIMLPIILITKGQLNWLWLVYPVNVFIHAAVDHLKANKRILNLVEDQFIHLVQITITWLFWALFIC